MLFADSRENEILILESVKISQNPLSRPKTKDDSFLISSCSNMDKVENFMKPIAMAAKTTEFQNKKLFKFLQK